MRLKMQLIFRDIQDIVFLIIRGSDHRIRQGKERRGRWLRSRSTSRLLERETGKGGSRRALSPPGRSPSLDARCRLRQSQRRLPRG